MDTTTSTSSDRTERELRRRLIRRAGRSWRARRMPGLSATERVRRSMLRAA